MKRINVIVSVMIVAVLLAVNLSVACFAAPSPEATTVQLTDDAPHVGAASTKKYEDANTGRISDGSAVNGESAVRTTRKVDVSSTAATTRGRNGAKTTNAADNSDSPNYTGDREVSSDRSETSPDTAAVSMHPAVAALVLLLLCAAVFAVYISRKSVKAHENN